MSPNYSILFTIDLKEESRFCLFCFLVLLVFNMQDIVTNSCVKYMCICTSKSLCIIVFTMAASELNCLYSFGYYFIKLY